MRYDDMLGWDIKKWQEYLHGLNLKIVDAGKINNRYYFQTSADIVYNKETKKTIVNGGAKIILPDLWEL